VDKTPLLSADKGAKYHTVIDIDMNAITEPIVCCPNDPDDAKLLSEVAGRPIDEVFIGSCMTNIGHFRAAGEVLKAVEKDQQVPTRLWIAPPTKMDEHQLTQEGWYRTFGAAGARLEMPGCSLCMGNQARIAEKSTAVSTSTRNFPNRLGKGADVFLASAELAAVSSIMGKLPTPEEYLAQYKNAALGTPEKQADIYRYLNFDQVEHYAHIAEQEDLKAKA
jgi:aconitate hydratase 2/2-methylisocitrate dehydratase